MELQTPHPKTDTSHTIFANFSTSEFSTTNVKSTLVTLWCTNSSIQTAFHSWLREVSVQSFRVYLVFYHWFKCKSTSSVTSEPTIWSDTWEMNDEVLQCSEYQSTRAIIIIREWKHPMNKTPSQIRDTGKSNITDIYFWSNHLLFGHYCVWDFTDLGWLLCCWVDVDVNIKSEWLVYCFTFSLRSKYDQTDGHFA